MKMARGEILEEIDSFRDLVSDIGGDVVDDFHGEQDDRPVKGLRCHHGKTTYVIYATEGNSFVTVMFQYRVLNDFIFAQIDEPEKFDVEISIDPEEQTELIENARSEMLELLNNIEEEVAQRFYIDILQKLKNDSVGYELYEKNENRVEGFEVTTKLFPQHCEITPKEFHDAVQSVLSIGVPTRAYIQYSYGLRRYGGGPTVHSNFVSIP